MHIIRTFHWHPFSKKKRRLKSKSNGSCWGSNFQLLFWGMGKGRRAGGLSTGNYGEYTPPPPSEHEERPGTAGEFCRIDVFTMRLPLSIIPLANFFDTVSSASAPRSDRCSAN